MKPKVFYKVDPHNRLIIKKTGASSSVKRFRQVVHGRFKTDSKNRLYYEVYRPYKGDIPQKIKFAGDYSLDKEHNLIMTLNRWHNQRRGNRLRLRTEIIDTRGKEIVLLINSKNPRNKSSSYTMRLHGSWKADKNNRLKFGVEKKKGKPDDLMFFNAWEINKNNEIVYGHSRDSKKIALKGQWHIKEKYRLYYNLEGADDSEINFRTSLGHLIPKKKKTYLKFDITIAISKKKRIKREVIFTCAGKVKGNKSFVLKAYPGKKRVALKLEKEVLDKAGLMYIESSLARRERYIGGGLAFRW